MTDVKIGTTWRGSNHVVFVVIHRIELEGKIWIHYRDLHAQEYSCYEESFLNRFTQYTN